MLKKAEFVHADLEYHEELITDAKVEFNEAFLDTISSWPRTKGKIGHFTSRMYKTKEPKNL